MNEPLAQRLRPKTLADVCGQQHLLAEGQVFRRTIESGHIPNMIFYGPSGTGKTTVARIIAENSGHKLNGPKGIGVMYIRKGVKIRSFIHGGAQERQRRAGTHNVPGIVGLGKAVELAKANMAERSAYETKLRDHLIERVTSEIPYTRLNGHRTDRLPNNANFCFRFIEGESMLILLDQAGICGSSGSACTSGSLDPSHVLLAIGLPHEIAHGSLRLTLSEKTTLEDIDYTVDKLKEIIARLRSMSPLYEDFVKKNGKSEA